MNDSIFSSALLSQWISHFVEIHAVPLPQVDFVAAEFERLVQEKRDCEKIDPLQYPNAPACPRDDDSTTCREEIFQAADGIYAALCALLERGHYLAFAQAAARAEWLGERPEHVSAVGYAAIRRSYDYSADDPAALDAERAALTQGASPAVAQRCARFLFDWDFHFHRALSAASLYEEEERKARAKGKSAAYAYAHAMQICIGEYSPHAIKRFALAVDQLVDKGMALEVAYMEAFHVLDVGD